MLILEVPFIEKEQAKSLGAKWDPIKKKWYVPAGVDADLFSKWWPDDFKQNNLTAEPATEQHKKLSQLLQSVSNVINHNLPGLTWITAEISELRQNKGNYYLTLVEYNEETKVAQAIARIWSSQEENTVIKFKKSTGSSLESGIKVLVQVSVNFHIQYGLSLVVHDIEPNYTIGNMAAKLAKIIDQLKKEGIIAKNKALPLPEDFTNVAVISPEKAAGLGDFCVEANILSKYSICNFDYYNATFQGVSAPGKIKSSLKEALERHKKTPYDAIVIIRGGGSVADLAWLNDLELAKEICTSPVKIICGIGHERDYTIIDEVSGIKLDTPSKVIGYIFHAISKNASSAEQDFNDIVNLAKNILQNTYNEINLLKELVYSVGSNLILLEKQKITGLIDEVYRLSPNVLNKAKDLIEQLMREVLLLGPDAVQKRGFVIVRTMQNEVVSSKKYAEKQDKLNLKFHDGELMVERCKNE